MKSKKEKRANTFVGFAPKIFDSKRKRQERKEKKHKNLIFEEN